jgi:hypothetical protein
VRRAQLGIAPQALGHRGLGLTESSQRLEGHGPPAIQLAGLLAERARLVEVAQRLGGLASLQENDAQVAAGLGRAGLEGHRLAPQAASSAQASLSTQVPAQ